jgi:hypothetical protein
MNILRQVGHQGDTQWYAVDGVPSNAKKIQKQFIAASERTGNVHALSGKYDMYEVDNGHVIECYEDCVLNHTGKDLLEGNWDTAIELPKRDHRSSVIPKGTYFVGIQQKFDPLSGHRQRMTD